MYVVIEVEVGRPLDHYLPDACQILGFGMTRAHAERHAINGYCDALNLEGDVAASVQFSDVCTAAHKSGRLIAVTSFGG